MEDVDKEDAKALLQWCEERSDQASRAPAAVSTIPSSARAKPAPATVATSFVPSVPVVRARAVEVEKSASALLLEYFPKDGDLSNHACLLVLAQSADARRHEVDNFPKDGDLLKLAELYDDLGDDFEELGNAYRDMGNQISPDAARRAYFVGHSAYDIGKRIYVREMNRLYGTGPDKD